MTVRTRVISFSADRTPSMRRIRLGFETDNLVERLEFVLPEIAESRTATLMMGGRYADAATLTESEEGRYCIDLTAELVGGDGEIEAYIRMDGAGGEVWNSGVMRLTTGALPDVETEIEKLYPTAAGQMLQAIAGHNAEMQEQTEKVQELLQAAQEAEAGAEESAEAAEKSANEAGKQAEDAAKAQQNADKSAENAAGSADAAEKSAEAAKQSADRAEEAVTSSGYVFFDIDSAGHLVMTKTENVNELDFRLNNGRLEVLYG